ncbi:MAG: HAD family hydrolase [Faecousia sp.]
MAELVTYLEDKGFKVYICSGTDRNADRVILSCFTDVPNYQVIGSDYYTEGTKYDEEYYLDYLFDPGEAVMRDDTQIIKNVKSSKIVQMAQEIGQKPVLAFGIGSV